jgi:molecular chaperone DnaK
VQGDVDALKTALQGDDEDAVKTAFDKLVLSQGKLGEAIYSATQNEAAADESGDATETPASSDEDIVDAEVVEDEPATDPKK